jgi:hypothetical protein
LLERDLHKRRTLTHDDLERDKERIVGYPIHVGIHERFAESLGLLARALGREFRASDLPVLNARTDVPAGDPGLEAEFSRRTRLDVELYEVRLFETRAAAPALTSAAPLPRRGESDRQPPPEGGCPPR